MSASDSGLQHATTPDRNILRLAKVMNLPGLGKAAHAANLDVNDAAGPTLDREGRGAGMHDRLIQADGSTQLFLQTGVVVDFVFPQGLLDHQKIELIEALQVFGLVE